MSDSPAIPLPADTDPLIGFAARMLDARRRRDRSLDPIIFCNPAWEMLLDLFVAGAAGRPAAETSQAACVPPGVARRWLSYLQRENMVIDATDRTAGDIVRLSDATRSAVRDYLSALTGQSGGTGLPLPPLAG